MELVLDDIDSSAIGVGVVPTYIKTQLNTLRGISFHLRLQLIVPRR